MLQFLFNDSRRDETVAPAMVVLDYVRRVARRPGTKEGCREGDCGACTVLIGERQGGRFRYQAMTSCLMPVGDLHGRHLVTIEGLNGSGLNAIQQALVNQGATQCGYCTPGFVVSLAGFLLGEAPLTEAEALAAIDGNICRCTGYVSIVRAVRDMLADLRDHVPATGDRLPALVARGVVPAYFADAPARLGAVDPWPSAPPGADIIGGGSDLYVQKAEALIARPVRLLSHEPGLREIREAEGDLYLGAMASTEDLLRSEALKAFIPDLEPTMRLVSSQLVRRRASVAGNIVNASPIGDLTIMLLALGAELGLRLGEQRRTLPLARFFLGYKQRDLRPGELIEWVRLPAARREYRFHFEKVSRRRYLDIASVNTAIGLRVVGGVVRDATLSAGGVGPIPMVLPDAAAGLCGAPVSPEAVRACAAVAVAAVRPISDVRGSAAYKRLLLRQLIYAHFVELFPEACPVESLCV